MFLALFATLAGAQTQKPNIIIILADDLGYGDLSCNGQQKFKTPHIDSIAENGMNFLNFYSGSTVCAPSRCTLMTGYSTAHSFIRGNIGTKYGNEGDLDMPPATVTIAKILQAQGYATGIFGKWGMGAQESPSAPLKMGFDRFYGYNGQGPAHVYYPPYLWSDLEKVPLPQNDDGKRGAYSAELIQNELMKFIEKTSEEKKPFFIYYATTIPHAELIAPESAMARFRGKFGAETPFNGKGNYCAQPEPKAAFAAMVTTLDDYVGQILDALKKYGELENTIIIFTSDNGTHLEGGHDPLFWNSSGGFRGNKRDLYEGGIHAPFLAMWKGRIKSASASPHIAAFWDLLPTLADAASAPAPEGIDGVSILPTLLGEGGQKEHPYLYWEFHEQGGKQAVLKGGWKLIKLDVNTPAQTRFELYNLTADKAEKKNLIDEEPELAAELKKIMQSARAPSPVAKFNFKN